MDPSFPDRMGELGDLSSEALNARWNAVVALSSSLDKHQKARSVLIACKAPIDRVTDEWFWTPFREAEDTFRIDDAVELHSRLAASTIQHLIGQGDPLTPLLVRLATLSGRTPVTPTVTDVASRALTINHATPPTYSPPKDFWFKTNQDVLKAPEGVTVAAVGSELDSAAMGAQSGMRALADQIRLMMLWAEDAERRFTNEQLLIQWLLRGTRDDGTPWSDLPASQVAIDGAAELAAFLDDAPQARHEAALGQLLAVSGATNNSETIVDGFQFVPVPVIDASLQTLTPLCQSFSNPDDSLQMSPLQLGTRVLWEIAGISLWEST